MIELYRLIKHLNLIITLIKDSEQPSEIVIYLYYNMLQNNLDLNLLLYHKFQ